MTKTIRCKVCGGAAYGRTEDSGDDRCDKCIADQAAGEQPPEFMQGRVAYRCGRSVGMNPYDDLDPLGRDHLWRSGWEWERDNT